MADPIEGQVVLIAGAKASIAVQRLPTLISRVQDDLGPRLDDYSHRYECVIAPADLRVFLAESGHWSAIGERLGFDRRETDAVQRAHTEQLLRIGRREDRREEYETALEIREAVVISETSDE